MRTHPYTLDEVTAMHEAALLRLRRTPEQLAETGANLGAVAAAAAAAERHRRNRELGITPELERIIEHLRDSFDTSYQAYEQLTDAMDIAPKDLADTAHIFEMQLDRWLVTGSLDYIREQQEQDPALSFSLVTVPNQVVNQDQLYQAARTFATGQDEWHVEIFHPLYNLYRDKGLSGSPVTKSDGTEQAVRFVLIPSQPTAAIGNTTVAAQRTALKQFTAEQTAVHPGITLKIPSVLDGVAWWYTLREQQREATDNPDKQLELDLTIQKEPYLRHIDLLEKKKPRGWKTVPISYAHDGDGRPRLYYSVVNNNAPVRVAVG